MEDLTIGEQEWPCVFFFHGAPMSRLHLGFPEERIRAGIVVPFHILHGALDTLVPLSHSRHTADLTHGSTLTVPAGHGHLSVIAELAGIAAGLMGSLKDVEKC